MANPTCYYSWTFPNELQDAWGDGFSSGVRQIDSTVRSITNLFGLIGRTTIVVSVVPNPPAPWGTMDGVALHTYNQNSFTFHSLSVAPYGEIQGNVTVTFSGCRVRIDVMFSETIQQDFTLSAYSSEIFAHRAFTQTQYRLLSNSINITGDSSWRIMHRGFGGQKAIWWTAMASLGVGTHPLTLEGRATSYLRTSAQATLPVEPTSCHLFSPACPVLIIATLESQQP